jgi:hypothetical protein
MTRGLAGALSEDVEDTFWSDSNGSVPERPVSTLPLDRVLERVIAAPLLCASVRVVEDGEGGIRERSSQTLRSDWGETGDGGKCSRMRSLSTVNLEGSHFSIDTRRVFFWFKKKGPHRDRWRPDITGDKRGELIGEESDVMSLR